MRQTSTFDAFDAFDEVTEDVRGASRCCQVSGWRLMPSWSLNEGVDLELVKDLHAKRICLDTKKWGKTMKNICKNLKLAPPSDVLSHGAASQADCTEVRLPAAVLVKQDIIPSLDVWSPSDGV